MQRGVMVVGRWGGGMCGIWECGVKEGNCLCVLLDRIH